MQYAQKLFGLFNDSIPKKNLKAPASDSQMFKGLSSGTVEKFGQLLNRGKGHNSLHFPKNNRIKMTMLKTILLAEDNPMDGGSDT